MASTFVRVRLTGVKRALTLKVTNESERFLSGYELNAEGEDVTGPGFDRRLQIIDKVLISKRTPLVMNKHTAELEVLRYGHD